jgi:hypothetical protein
MPQAWRRQTQADRKALRRLQPPVTPYHHFGFPLAAGSASPGEGATSNKTPVLIQARERERVRGVGNPQQQKESPAGCWPSGLR